MERRVTRRFIDKLMFYFFMYFRQIMERYARERMMLGMKVDIPAEELSKPEERALYSLARIRASAIGVEERVVENVLYAAGEFLCRQRQ